MDGSSATDRPGVGARFGFLVVGLACSVAGNYLSLIALGLFTYEVTGSGVGVGLVMALRLGAGVLGGVLGGRLSARRDRRTIMIGADLAQAAAMAVLVVGAPGRDLVLLGAVVAVLGVANPVFTVALRTSVPEIVGQDARVRANGLLVSAKSVGTVAGFGGAGVVIGVGGVQAAFAVNAASFVVSALAIAVVRPRTDTATAPATGPAARSGPLALLPGVLLGMVALRGVDALASASHNVALPVLASTVHAADGAGFLSRFWVSWAIGMLLAHQVSRRSEAKAGGSSTEAKAGGRSTFERTFAVATCVMAVAFAAAFTDLPVPLVMVAALLAGLADGVTEIAYTSRLQEVPEHRRGRLFGLSASVETSGFAVGMVAAGVAVDALPAVVVVVAFHAVALAAAAVFLLVRHVRGADDDRCEDGDADVGPVRGTGARTDR